MLVGFSYDDQKWKFAYHKEVNDGHECGIEDSEDNVSSPAEVCKSRRHDHNDYETEKPVTTGGNSIRLCTGS